MAQESFVVDYRRNYECLHCLWLAQKNNAIRRITGKDIPELYKTIDPSPEDKFIGLSVYNSSDYVVENAFNCVNGVYPHSMEQAIAQHNPYNLSNALYGATIFIVYLFHTYRIEHASIILNSKYGKEYQGKEHVHVWVVVEDKNETKLNSIFDKKKRQADKRGNHLVKIYKGDTVIPLSHDQCCSLIREQKVENIVVDIFDKHGIKNFDIIDDDFYIFIDYDFESVRNIAEIKDWCDITLTGKLTTDPATIDRILKRNEKQYSRQYTYRPNNQWTNNTQTRSDNKDWRKHS